jgi:sulfite reductase (NADPH) flavoprotein alpha-component
MDCMSEATAVTPHVEKYTRNNPFQAEVTVNELLTAEGSEKETRHLELTLDEGMEYTPGDV